MRLAEGVGDPHQRFWALVWRATTLTQAGRLEEADRILADMYEIVGRVQDPRLRFVAAAQQAWRAQLAGRIDEAERLAEAALALGQDAGEPDAVTLFAAQLIPIRWHQGRLAEEAGLADFIVVSAPQVGLFRALSALAAYEAGDPAEAQRQLAATAESAFELPRDPVRLGSWCIWAELATQLGDRGAAAILLTHLQGLRDCVVTEALGTLGVVSRCVGSLAGTLGRRTRPTTLQACTRRSRTHGRGVAGGGTRIEWGAMLAGAGRSADARVQLSTARRPRPSSPSPASSDAPARRCWRSARPWSADAPGAAEAQGRAEPMKVLPETPGSAERQAQRRARNGDREAERRRGPLGQLKEGLFLVLVARRAVSAEPVREARRSVEALDVAQRRRPADDVRRQHSGCHRRFDGADVEPVRVQSPVRTRLSRPLWPGQSRCSIVPGGVST